MSPGLGGLRRLTQPAPEGPAAATSPAPEERCEFCGVGISARHGHVADTHDHRLLCVCRPCHLLFAPDGAGGGRYRGVGDDGAPRRRPGARRGATGTASRSRSTWRSSSGTATRTRFHAFYPGPGGATESTLDLASWTTVLDANPEIAGLMPDVEAVLLRHHDPGFSALVTPIDVCYELVGIVREHWEGSAAAPRSGNGSRRSSRRSTVAASAGRAGQADGCPSSTFACDGRLEPDRCRRPARRRSTLSGCAPPDRRRPRARGCDALPGPDRAASPGLHRRRGEAMVVDLFGGP